MADTDQPTVERHINWGGVLKGVAIVAAVAVAAVVGAWLVGSILMPAIMGTINVGAGSSLLAGAGHVATWGASTAGTIAGSTVHLLSGIPAGLASILGLTGQHFVQAAAVNHTMGIVGGAAAVALVTPPALSALQHNHIISVDPSVHTETGVMATTTVPMHDLAHMTHHAAEHADEHASTHVAAPWVNRVVPTPRVNSITTTTFADKVNASKEERKTAAPAANFTDQLNTDRANLDAALAK